MRFVRTQGFRVLMGVILIPALSGLVYGMGRGGRRGGGAGRGGVQAPPPSNRIAVCSPDTATSSAPYYGIVLSREPNNGNLIAADTYLLNDSKQKVKQVGHAEVAQETASDSSIILNVASTDDSPSAFSMTISYSASADTEEAQARPEFTGDLASEALFTGENVSNLTLNCRVDGPVPEASSSPTPEPSASYSPSD